MAPLPAESCQRPKLSFPGANPHPAIEAVRPPGDPRLLLHRERPREVARRTCRSGAGCAIATSTPASTWRSPARAGSGRGGSSATARHRVRSPQLPGSRVSPCASRARTPWRWMATSLRLTTAAGELTLPLLTAERSNVQRANAARVNVQGADAGGLRCVPRRSPPHAPIGNPLSAIRNPLPTTPPTCSTAPSWAAVGNDVRRTASPWTALGQRLS